FPREPGEDARVALDGCPMREPHDTSPFADLPLPEDLFDAGLEVAFGPGSGPGVPGNPALDTDALPPAEASGRYVLSGEIARGGMGAILRGHAPALRRDLAVKVLLPAHRGNTALVERFVEEAQIGGQLQHPGIVPVYELGSFGDDRPYFTMKLV